MKRFLWSAGLLAVRGLALLCGLASGQTVASLRFYEQHCATCHGNPAGPKNAGSGYVFGACMPGNVLLAVSAN